MFILMFGRHGVALAFRTIPAKKWKNNYGKILSLSAFQLTILKTVKNGVTL
jgi:hypothetical protein